MEAVLIMIVTMSVALKISNYASESGFIRNIVEGPWGTVRGMIEDGVWTNYTDSKTLHPNHLKRHQSKRGDDT